MPNPMTRTLSVCTIADTEDHGTKSSKPLVIHHSAEKDSDFSRVHKKLQEYWPIVLEEILGDEELKGLYDTSDYFRSVLEYNVPFGKQQRACMFLHMSQMLRPNMTQDEEDKMYKAAWILEILQTSALIYDDVMDDSTTRRGKLCWHMRPDVGKSAINDAIYLENIVYKMLHSAKHEEKDGNDKYLQTMEFIHSIILKSTYGQSMDTRLPLSGSILNYTMDKYQKIVKYKTTLYTFYGPMGMAMILNGILTQDNIKLIDEITTLIGEFFQIQDDYLDCFGDPNVTGKIGTDIQDRKCSWLVVKALELASGEQKTILLESYGKKDMDSVRIVKEIYSELDLEGVYFDHEDETFNLINRKILSLPAEIPKAPFNLIIKTIYKRNK